MRLKIFSFCLAKIQAKIRLELRSNFQVNATLKKVTCYSKDFGFCLAKIQAKIRLKLGQTFSYGKSYLITFLANNN